MYLCIISVFCLNCIDFFFGESHRCSLSLFFYFDCSCFVGNIRNAVILPGFQLVVSLDLLLVSFASWSYRWLTALIVLIDANGQEFIDFYQIFLSRICTVSTGGEPAYMSDAHILHKFGFSIGIKSIWFNVEWLEKIYVVIYVCLYFASTANLFCMLSLFFNLFRFYSITINWQIYRR